MFFFQRDYFREARGQHLKIFFYSLLMMILASVAIMILPAVLIGMGVGLANEENFAPGILGLIFGVVILFAGSIFILMPLQYSIYAYYMFGYTGKDVEFRDGLFLFKKGNYWKSIGLILLLFIMMFAISSLVSGVIYGVGFGILSLLGAGSALFDPDTIETLSVPAIIAFIGVQLLLAFLQFVVSLLIAISMAMIVLNHIDQPQNTLGSKFSKGLSIAFKSGKDLLKLFFSNVLLNLVPFLIMFIFIIIVILTAFVSPALGDSMIISVVGVAVFVIGFIVATAFVTYLQLGSFISYYFQGRDYYEGRYETAYEEADADAQHITMS